MKKLLLLATVVLGISTMSAQKNSILLGGNFTYSHDENKAAGVTTETDNYEISPVLGYQFSDNWTLGAKATFGKADKGAVNEKTTKLGGFVRYTQPFNETFAIYGDLGGGWRQQKVDSDNKADGFYVDLTPALFINFKNSFGLNFSIGGIEYNHLKEKGSNAKDNQFKLTFGQAFNIGISKNFAL